MKEKDIADPKFVVLRVFMDKLYDDSRMTAVHISLFCALWAKWRDTEGRTIVFFTRDIMPLSKISSVSTYHKAIKQLGEYGYIKYEPSYNHNTGSKVEFLDQ